MGSWNAVCLTIPTESPTRLLTRVEHFLDQDWQDLTADISLPEDTPSLADRELTPDDFAVKTRGEYVYLHAAGHNALIDGLDAAAYVFLANLEPEMAAVTHKFEDGQGACAIYRHLDSAGKFVRKNNDRIDEIGYVKAWEAMDWESPYGVEHAANVVGTKYDLDLGIGELSGMYVLDVRRHRL